MSGNPKIKIENPTVVFVALSFLLISLTLIVIGIFSYKGMNEETVFTEEEEAETVDDTQDINDFFEEGFQDYEVPDSANLEYLKNDPFRGTCTGGEGEGKAPFAYGVVCLH